jgi:hypothetical protein
MKLTFANICWAGLSLLLGLVIFKITNAYMYTKEVAEFYGKEYSILDDGIIPNGGGGFGPVINVTGLKAKYMRVGLRSEYCPDVKSLRLSGVSISFIGSPEFGVCCLLAGDNQWLVPYKDVGKERHYLCGKWPNLDHVIQPIVNSVRNLNSE